MSNTHKTRLSLTPLEGRELMSVASVALSGGILTVRTDSASTSVEVQSNAAGVCVRNAVSGWTSSSYAGVNEVDFIGGSGNDRFVTHLTTTKIRAWGQGGDDYLEGYNNNDDLIGGTGNDTLAGYGGNDKIWGEAGNDLLQGMDGHDQLLGGIGNDSLYGGNGNDKLWGEAGADYLRGDAGWDSFVTDAADTMRQRSSNGLGLMFGPTVLDAGVAVVGSLLGSAWNAANQQTINGGSSIGNTGTAAQVGIVAIDEFDPNATSEPLNCLSGGYDYDAVAGTVDVLQAGWLAVYVDNG